MTDEPRDKTWAEIATHATLLVSTLGLSLLLERVALFKEGLGVLSTWTLCALFVYGLLENAHLSFLRSQIDRVLRLDKHGRVAPIHVEEIARAFPWEHKAVWDAVECGQAGAIVAILVDRIDADARQLGRLGAQSGLALAALSSLVPAALENRHILAPPAAAAWVGAAALGTIATVLSARHTSWVAEVRAHLAIRRALTSTHRRCASARRYCPVSTPRNRIATPIAIQRGLTPGGTIGPGGS
ncbi:MAG: hypothetical protein HYV07_05095 [Deltaproteobacteria bacterium]|nr:hypothetical protein [Deltaproteobacteria bacterium]